MKVLKYQILQSILKNGEAITLDKVMEYSEANEKIAKAEAYKGEYAIISTDSTELFGGEINGA